MEMEEEREGRDLEDSTEIAGILSTEDNTESLDLESLEISQIYEETLESIESLDSLEMNDLNSTLSSTIILEECGEDPCSFIFANSGLTDQAVGKSFCYFILTSSLTTKKLFKQFSKNSLGGILLVVAFLIFLVSYILLVKFMKCLISFSLAGDGDRDRDRTSHLLSRDLPYIPWATDYLWILLSSGFTVLVQSSSIVTSALVPLVSSELITLEVRIVIQLNILT